MSEVKEYLKELDYAYGIITLAKSDKARVYILAMIDDAIEQSGNFKEAVVEILQTYPKVEKYLVQVVKENYPEKLDEFEKIRILL
jgi:hypothetical protein